MELAPRVDDLVESRLELGLLPSDGEGAPAVEALDTVTAGCAVLHAGVGRVAARAYVDRERRSGRAKRELRAAGRAGGVNEMGLGMPGHISSVRLGMNFEEPL